MPKKCNKHHHMPWFTLILIQPLKLHRCVAEIKMQAKFEDGCGLTNDYFVPM